MNVQPTKLLTLRNIFAFILTLLSSLNIHHISFSHQAKWLDFVPTHFISTFVSSKYIHLSCEPLQKS